MIKVFDVIEKLNKNKIVHFVVTEAIDATHIINIYADNGATTYNYIFQDGELKGVERKFASVEDMLMCWIERSMNPDSKIISITIQDQYYNAEDVDGVDEYDENDESNLLTKIEV